MIVSALLTSVGINTALCVLFWTLYSILRKQPSNYEVYVPRLLVEGTSKRRSHFNLERLIPSAGWVAKAWKLSEEELYSSSGLDGVVFMRIITFRYYIFLDFPSLGDSRTKLWSYKCYRGLRDNIATSIAVALTTFVRILLQYQGF